MLLVQCVVPQRQVDRQDVSGRRHHPGTHQACGLRVQDKWPVKPSEANILAQSGEVSFAFTRNFSLPVADSAGNTEQLNILAASLLSLSNLGWSSADVYYRELLDAGTDDQLMSSSMIMMISTDTALQDAFAAIKYLKDPMFYLVQQSPTWPGQLGQ